MFASRPTHPITGRRFRIRARTQRELDAYLHRLDRLRNDLKFGLLSPEQADRALRFLQHGPVTLERAAIAYVGRARLAPSTRENVRGLIGGRLRPLLPLALTALDRPRVSQWIDGLARAGLQLSTIDNLWRRLRAIVGHASERGWIGALPWGDYRPRLRHSPARVQREAARTLEEFARILFAARDLDCTAWVDEKDAGDREAMMACAGLLGLRQGELAGLRWTDIDPGPPITIHIARQWNGQPLKSNTPPRRLQTIPELGEILAVYRSRLELVGLFDPHGPVFPWREGSTGGRPVHYARGEPLSRRNVRAAVSHAGLPNVRAWSAHSLRDTFVTLEAGATGGDLARVAARSRHASLASLARYLRSFSRHNPSAPAIQGLPGRSLACAKGPPARIPHALPPPKETPP
jgi:integrase